MPLPTLSKFRKNSYSQNGEDGVIAELVQRLGLRKGVAVEFGAWDGKHLSNTFNLVENYNWRAIYIEGNANKFVQLVSTSKEYPAITPVMHFLRPEHGDLDRILSERNISNDYDILSIDIDSCDYQIWQSHTKFKPKIVIIEINSSIPPDIEQIHNSLLGRQGSSFVSTLLLGKEKGYTLVLHTGNMIFVRDDLLPLLELSENELTNPTCLFDSSWLPKPYLIAIYRSIKRRMFGGF